MSTVPAIILAGGLGTRLRSTFHAGPKSMAPIAGAPFLEYMLTRLRAEGIADVVLCVGYKRSHIQRHFRMGTKWRMRLRYSIEDQLLGTAGAIKKAADLVRSETLFVCNGDSFLDLDLQRMEEFHRERNAVATIALTAVSDSNRYGSVVVDSRGAISAFREKQAGPGTKGRPCLISAGAYLLNRRVLDQIPGGGPVSIEKEVFPKLAGGGLYGYFTDGYFIDIGVPDSFSRAQRELPMRWTI